MKQNRHAEPETFPLDVGGGRQTRALGWHLGSPSNTAILIHHGLGEHAGRYGNLAQWTGGRPMIAFDARGHGHDPGKRGDGGTLHDMAQVLGTVLPAVLAKAGVERVVLFGHSMGAAVVGTYLVASPKDPRVVGAILSAPPVEVHRTNGVRFKLLFAPLLARFIPHRTVANSIDPHAISSVAREVKRYRNDPLIHNRVSFQLGHSLIRDAEALVSKANQISVPTLLYLGADDPILVRTGVESFAGGLGHSSRFTILRGARHEPHHESPEVQARVGGQIQTFLETVHHHPPKRMGGG